MVEMRTVEWRGGEARLALPRGGRGPGVVVLADPASFPLDLGDACTALAQEGYAVLGLDVAAHPDIGVGDLDGAITTVAPYGDDGKSGIVGYGRAARLALHAASHAMADAVAAYCGADFAVALEPAGVPRVRTVLHLAGADPAAPAPFGGHPRVKAFAYPDCRPGFTEPAHGAFERDAARLAASRTLGVLRAALGPDYHLSALFQAHLREEFVTKDSDATMATMIETPYVNHVPTMTGGVGYAMLKRFYKYHFIPRIPADRRTIILNEIVGADSVVIEALNCFTHDREIDHILPGIPPTGKYVEVPIVVIAKFQGDRLCHEHIYWDQASLLVQLGLIDPAGLPVAGIAQARKVRDETRRSNELMASWKTSEGKPL